MQRSFVEAMARSAAVMVGVLLSNGLPVGIATGATPVYNLVVIHTDEHNFRTLGCYRELLPKAQAYMWGSAVVETPNIDWIAHNGAVCTSFYATTPVCSPSRSSFTTGCYPQTTSVTTNNIQMRREMVTFAEVLRRAGYATGYAGKWHLNGSGKPEWAPKPEFGFQDNRYMFNRGHWKQLEDTARGPRVAARKNGKPTYSVAGATAESFTTDFLTTKTIDFIQTHHDQPFCFMVSLPDPHGPDTVRPPYDTMYAGQTYDKPRSYDAPEGKLPSWAERTKCGYNQSKYYGMVKCIDDNVGRILKCLRTSELLEKTIVVFTADHGDLRGEHARQNKGVPFDGSAQIPFVIYASIKIPARTVVNQALACVDFKPTVLSIMGVDSAGPTEGRNCATLLTTGRAPEDWQDVVFLRSTSSSLGHWIAAVSDDYKLVCGKPDHPWLYDLKKDPNELTNFFTDPAHRNVVRRLCQAMLAYGKRYHDDRVADPGMRYDLQWGARGTGTYSFTNRPAAARKRAARGGNKTRKTPATKKRKTRM